MFLLLALSHLDRLTDADCLFPEYLHLTSEIAHIRKFLTPVEAGYLEAITHVVQYAQSIQ